MVKYVKAKKNHKFVLTALGLEMSRIRAKFDDRNRNYNMYIYTVPTAWVEKGYVEEVEIDG